MKIKVLCEGKTERVFRDCLMRFLRGRIQGDMPSIRFDVHDGAIPRGDKLRKLVQRFLAPGILGCDAVVALTDVYPGFANAGDAKAKMREWVGEEPRFYPHAAQYDFEAWLLPYWDTIQRLAKVQRAPFAANPETVNNTRPPSQRLKELFEAGNCRDSYSKPRDAMRILRDADLLLAINACRELRAFVNTILSLCGAEICSA